MCSYKSLLPSTRNYVAVTWYRNISRVKINAATLCSFQSKMRLCDPFIESVAGE